MSKTKTQQEQQLEQEKLREIFMLLSQLFAKEEVIARTRSQIICTTDMSSINY